MISVSCQNISESKSEVEINEKQIEYNFVDTTCLNFEILKDHQINFNIIDNPENWVFSKVINYGLEHLKSIHYYYSVDRRDKCKTPINKFNLDSLQISLPHSKIQKVKIPKYSSSVNLEELLKINQNIGNLNFDEFADLEIILNDISGSTNLLKRYLIYNPIDIVFEKGIDLANVKIDSINKLIYHSWNGGHSGKISTRNWIRINNYDEIITHKEVSSDYNKTLDSYIVFTKELHNGEYITKLDTLSK